MAAPRTATLAGFYFFHFGLLGLLMPYLPLYLQGRGLSGGLIGLLMGCFMGTKLIGPPLIGRWIDRRGDLVSPLRWSLGAVLGAWLLFGQAQGAALLSLSFVVFTLAWNATLPPFETLTLHRLGPAGIGGYGRVRLWGSVGFIVASGAGSVWLARSTALIQHLPLAGLMMVTGMLICGWLQVPARPTVRSMPPADGRARLRRPGVAAFLVTVFLLNLSHGPYYAYLTLYLESLGYGSRQIGLLWALGVVAEIGLFWAAPMLFQRFSRRHLLLTALALTVVRWALIAALANRPAALVAAQMLHLASFGLCHAVGMSYVYALFPGPLQGRGQALYSALGFGAGGLTGGVLAGLLWSAGWRGELYLMAALAAVLALIVAWCALPSGGARAVAPAG
ncbi:MAG TPA: MFS transporter [Candidatus Macondimonas sp.]|nr:MFS transporter [Candidatus Macondimonas sp.]